MSDIPTSKPTASSVDQAVIERRAAELGAEEWSDARLIEEVGRRLALPRRDPADSFVLHAPLELLARAALLGRVRPSDRARARAQVVSLLVRFEAVPAAEFGASKPVDERDDIQELVGRLFDAIRAEDLDAADRVVVALTQRASTGELVRHLGAPVLPLLAAAGHAPIYLFLAPRVAPRGEVTGGLLRPLVRELARVPSLRIEWIDDDLRASAGSAAMLGAALRDAPALGEPGSNFIFPLMHQVDVSGLAAELIGPAIAGLDARTAAPVLTRHAARAMILADSQHAPYGWSHCLTMSQAALGIAATSGDPQRAVAVAATYVLGFLAGEASTPVPPEVVLADPGGAFVDAVAAGPRRPPLTWCIGPLRFRGRQSCRERQGVRTHISSSTSSRPWTRRRSITTRPCFTARRRHRCWPGGSRPASRPIPWVRRRRWSDAGRVSSAKMPGPCVDEEPSMTTADRKPASLTTQTRNHAARRAVPNDPIDFEEATRGRIAPLPGPAMHPEFGFPVWDPADWEFVSEDAPPSVHPSLWRQAQLNAIHGLFEVADGIYQVRGVDLSNVTFIAGETGWIVIDPLTATETAAFALELLHAHFPSRPVVAVMYTHSHVDHFGGVRGVTTDEAVAAGDVEIIAPVGFLEAAIAENVVAGPAMRRRASYMYGRLLPGDELGHVDCGLGKAIPLLGTSGLIAPTVDITFTGEERVVDGVRFEFQYTPDTEAPAEMNINLPDRRILCMAENCAATLHNVYTPRGVQIRDALAWSKYLHESIQLFGDRTDIVFMSHHWPRWGTEHACTFMEEQRDTYRWIHDETMRRANQGATAIEIAETLEAPPGLEGRAHVRGYYGTINHNAKAVYQRYLGWFDANPAHLHPLPPTDAGTRYVEYMGGVDAVLEKVQGSIDAGDYRWAAQVLDHVIFAAPHRSDALLLQADVFEQLGYTAESGPWRDFYLTGAQELRHGVPDLRGATAAGLDMLRAMTTEMLVDLMAVRLDGTRAEALTLDLTVADRDEIGALGIDHGVVHYSPGVHHASADVGMSLDHLDFARLASGRASLAEVGAGVTITGDRDRLDAFLGWLDYFDASFAIASP